MGFAVRGSGLYRGQHLGDIRREDGGCDAGGACPSLGIIFNSARHFNIGFELTAASHGWP